MKKIIIVFESCLLLILCLSLFSCATIKKEEIVYIQRDYISEYEEITKNKDEEALLALFSDWEKEDKNNPELLSFMTQYYISKAYEMQINVSPYPPKEGLSYTMAYDDKGNTVYNVNVPLIYDEPFEKAIKTAKKAISLYPNRIDFYINQIILYQEVCNYEEAKNVMIDLLLQTQKENNVWYTNMNKLLFNPSLSKRENEVMFINLLYDIACRQWFYIGGLHTNYLLSVVYKEIENTFPHNAHLYLIMGRDLLGINKVDEGEKYLLKAFEIENENYDVIKNLALIYTLMKPNKEKAMKYINLLLESNNPSFVKEGENFLNVIKTNKIRR